MTGKIAILGMACRFPDASTPDELWENILAQRSAFRRIPAERMRIEDYMSLGGDDDTYSTEAALIENFEFDRKFFCIGAETFRAVDPSHWLALSVASQALQDAGFPNAADIPRESTGVLVGNTLTGDVSRANSLRLRWPYVRRVVEAVLLDEGFSPEKRRDVLVSLEQRYKNPFPQAGDETLAGSLSNTIGGRICNYFDFKGGTHTVDGACASSLLAITTACSLLVSNDLDVALAGGVDLSIDPFELIGFAKLGALARGKMRVYDANPTGFLPGEGCGFVVLMRHRDAVAQQRRIYAVISGWGTSSDGSGGITRPEREGQLLAVSRAYKRAAIGIETVTYFEGHGTGTSVGDATELGVLGGARRSVQVCSPPAVIGSVKANIGHTKAAAGVAGFIKALKAVNKQVIPPTTGCVSPHAELLDDRASLRIATTAEIWPEERPLRAGVSAMGFGGINVHIVLEGTAHERRKQLDSHERRLCRSVQDAELFLFGAATASDLRSQTARVRAYAGRLSCAELTDLAIKLANGVAGDSFRAALVASTPSELASKLTILDRWLEQGAENRLDPSTGVFLSHARAKARIGFLFPGQGSPVRLKPACFGQRFPQLHELYENFRFPDRADLVATSIAQPAIALASVACLRLMSLVGIEAAVGVGHSMGELTALHWGGAFDEEALVRIATVRGHAMMKTTRDGAMASIGASPEDVKTLMDGEKVVIAGFNGPFQTVISGERTGVENVMTRAQANGASATRLRVSHAFHSDLVADCAHEFIKQLKCEHIGEIRRPIASTISGSWLNGSNLSTLLLAQITSPVRFMQAIQTAAPNVDLFVEVGSGQTLTGIAESYVEPPVVSVDFGANSLVGLLKAVGAAFVLGSAKRYLALYEDRFSRPFDLDWAPRFFVNPCELAPVGKVEAPKSKPKVQEQNVPTSSSMPALLLLRQRISDFTKLPLESIKGEDRFLSDLHLNSISVGRLVTEAARQLGVASPAVVTDYSNVTVADAAAALEGMLKVGSPPANRDNETSGVDSWIRAFILEWVEQPLPRSRSVPPLEAGEWQVITPSDHYLTGPLQEAARCCPGKGILALVPTDDEKHVPLLLKIAGSLLSKNRPPKLVLVQEESVAGGFGKTLHLETRVQTCVITAPLNNPRIVEWVLSEANATSGFSEVLYDSDGRRFEPRLRVLPHTAEELGVLPIGPEDVLLVTGGGKGIAAECAIHLARSTGVHVVVLGRSQPGNSAELDANLARMKAASIEFRYYVADVSDSQQVQRALHEARQEFGPVTAIIHSAGTNTPQPLSSLDEEGFSRTLAPKIRGAQNILASIDAARLKLFITFGSIIARTGMVGDADYAVANEWLANLVARWQTDHPHCRCLNIEWSIWSGVGMGQRLGSVDSLMRHGITPIPPDEGIRWLHSLIGYQPPATSVIVTGRLGNPPTLKRSQAEIPFSRFLEKVRVNNPGIEIVADAEISTDSDPYLLDHVFEGQMLFPAVMGLEAMAQAAKALAGTEKTAVFENLAFNRPIVIRAGETLVVRVAALMRSPDRIDVVLRSAETDFQANHFSVTCRLVAAEQRNGLDGSLAFRARGDRQIDLQPETDLYGVLLFHKGRFRRLRSYDHLTATECIVNLNANHESNWFSAYLPDTLELGDPGSRDAAIHAIQACIPHRTILPTGAARVSSYGRLSNRDHLRVVALQREQQADTFIYDVEITDGAAHLLERWEGLQLRSVGQTVSLREWPEALVAPYLERRIPELVPGAELKVQVAHDHALVRRERSDQIIQDLLGNRQTVVRRPDGKVDAGDRVVSVAHANEMTLVVAGGNVLGCDVEVVSERPEQVWRDLLGNERFDLARIVAREAREPGSSACTRVWSASECLTKAGALINAPLHLLSLTPDGWVLMSSGAFVIATTIISLRGQTDEIVLAVLGSQGNHAGI